MGRILLWAAIAVLVYYLITYEILPYFNIGHD